MTLGKHEFDRGDDVLGEFLSNLTFPILSANIVSSHPVLNRTIKTFHIYEKFGVAARSATQATISEQRIEDIWNRGYTATGVAKKKTKKKKTYNSRDSLMVTHSTTNPPI